MKSSHEKNHTKSNHTNHDSYYAMHTMHSRRSEERKFPYFQFLQIRLAIDVCASCCRAQSPCWLPLALATPPAHTQTTPAADQNAVTFSELHSLHLRERFRFVHVKKCANHPLVNNDANRVKPLKLISFRHPFVRKASF